MTYTSPTRPREAAQYEQAMQDFAAVQRSMRANLNAGANANIEANDRW